MLGRRSNQPDHRVDVCVVGSGTRFVSGLSYFTHRLAVSFGEQSRTSVILMRQLIPTRFYPGRDRVGEDVMRVEYPADVEVYNGVDWFLLPSIFGALRQLSRDRPRFVVFQWWTGAVSHIYLLLAVFARLRGSRCIVEFHEVQDTGELRIPLAGPYARVMRELICKLSSGFVVHSEHDRSVLTELHDFASKPVSVIHHGPFDHHNESSEVAREAPPEAFNILYFGTIRPYKGLEDLVRAYEMLDDSLAQELWLTVVGETWENWTLPTELIESSARRDRITFLNSYVDDDAVSAYFAGADAAVLPYRRSSASGPLHIAMSQGLPTVVTDIPALKEAVEGYEGVILVEPERPDQIAKALAELLKMRGERFADIHSWERTVERFEDLFARIEDAPAVAPNPPGVARTRTHSP